jgi:lipoprotein-anchoring transpeptidase ErfK/SrfK
MRTAQISAAWRQRCEQACGVCPADYLYVDVTKQRMYLVRANREVRSFTVSTASAGTGNREGSLQTPPGIHRIYRKIGHGAPRYRIFESREDTGLNWTPAMGTGTRRVLTRILWLDGCEDGINRGGPVDSRTRYIYIHGTSNEAALGTPKSHGCITMHNDELIEMFDMVEEGMIVIID